MHTGHDFDFDILNWGDTEKQPSYRDWLFFFTSGLVSFPFWVPKKMKINHRFFIVVCFEK